MTKFKVGDKVRILNAGEISACAAKDGDILDVVDLTDDGRPYVTDVDGCPLVITTRELAYIEALNAKPTKKQRMKKMERTLIALESEVNVLKAEVEALKQAQVRTDVAKIADRLAELVADEPVLTPNELRKAIIAEARAFVAKVEAQIASPLADRTQGNYTYQDCSGYAKYNVNAEKRTVVALVYGKYCGKLREKAIAKCAPGDVFNADIGKAIALGRALGLDVSKFEQAVQPTEVVVGHYVYFSEECPRELVVEQREQSFVGHKIGVGCASYWLGQHVTQILDDTEAQYE